MCFVKAELVMLWLAAGSSMVALMRLEKLVRPIIRMIAESCSSSKWSVAPFHTSSGTALPERSAIRGGCLGQSQRRALLLGEERRR
ncbi:hypothetical protein [Streptomyces sp. NPDC018031]|uniref:hypothetical protein n=1 Tax=Streptomyces sp. NPDC018031 TaxID=3365033 RepID=UPI0037B45D07